MSALGCIKSEPDIIDNTTARLPVSSCDNNGINIKTEVDLEYVKEDEDLTIKQEAIYIKEEIEFNDDGDINDICGTFPVETATKYISEVYVKAVNNIAGNKIIYQCNMCKFQSSYKCALTRHMRIHTEEKPSVCQICEYKCSQKSALRNHMRIHIPEEKLFVCQICEYKCSARSALARHIKIHTGEKPFICEICQFKTAQKSALTEHLRIHTGEKPFVCQICEYKTARKRTLNEHMQRHTKEAPFVCQICKYRCSQKNALTRHVNKLGHIKSNYY